VTHYSHLKSVNVEEVVVAEEEEEEEEEKNGFKRNEKWKMGNAKERRTQHQQ
jgi:hypothetical protein